MKASAAITIAIIVIGFLASVIYQSQISTAREHQIEIEAKAMELGILPTDRTGRRMTKRIRDENSPSSEESLQLARNLDSRDAALAELRNHLAESTSEAERVETREAGFAALAEALADEGFQKSTAWLETANLSAPELAAFATGLEFSQTAADTSQWIGWLSDHLEMNDLNEPVAELMTDWTRDDYIAAGEWLAAAPESAGKRAAVAAYAETVAGTEPQTAVQWALTLPDTWRREAVMRAIHENWPTNDPQGAAAFAEQQGIK